MKQIGVDAGGNRLHCSVLDKNNNLLELKKWVSKNKDSKQRFYEIMDSIQIDINNGFFDGASVKIEAPLYIQNFKTSLTISNMISGLELKLHDRGIKDVILVGNTTWKKVVIGSGKSSKEQIKQFIVEKMKINEDLEQDYYDSIGISLYRKES